MEDLEINVDSSEIEENRPMCIHTHIVAAFVSCCVLLAVMFVEHVQI